MESQIVVPGFPAQRFAQPYGDLIFTLSILEPSCDDIVINLVASTDTMIPLTDQPENAVTILSGNTDVMFKLNLPDPADIPFFCVYQLTYSIEGCDNSFTAEFFAEEHQ